MRLVGNDVVDLDDPAIATSHLRERFVARVLSEAERRRLDGAPDPKAFVWAHFAAKEAAYKVLAKLHPSPLLAHRRFEVDAARSTVRSEDAVLNLRVDVRGPCVHAVAWLGEHPPTFRVASAVPGEDPSLTVRALVLDALGGGPGLQVVREPIRHSWDGFGPPRVLRGAAPVDVDVSLSHDGRYVAWALVPAGGTGHVRGEVRETVRRPRTPRASGLV